MTAQELLDLSKRLEDATGYDSIATVTEHYLRSGQGAILCAYSSGNTYGTHDCRFSRRDPVAVWLHVHFGRSHGYSFGKATPAEVAADEAAAIAYATDRLRQAERVR